ncbi:hypothetical protein SLEP1_g33161 [Rubroshorea leprosula]|uniref:Uncharacterized protein n=1 Tax=Rubroshorea leprosula TaxID=152421 RepID=A0AAV5KFR2_9ROSI|nr:hypothetical protein SLEP1_g33157 [Rubroshorea leprosula]GKV23432.1 hypothetical protein SLEP1_g33161 [Rubroshorea leprosula]
MSIEALAMAGADYIECGIDVELWENGGKEEQPPVYLLADKISGSVEVERKGRSDEKERMVKAKMLQWAKLVASMNETAVQLKRTPGFS